mmetsp:Transcript_3188/g.4324  ORF Transcript_3188/g.4324 Transcript_3188/m.4324 type:complete len:88 (-) Transcript_3188:311-574(-)
MQAIPGKPTPDATPPFFSEKWSRYDNEQRNSETAIPKLPTSSSGLLPTESTMKHASKFERTNIPPMNIVQKSVEVCVDMMREKFCGA